MGERYLTGPHDRSVFLATVKSPKSDFLCVPKAFRVDPVNTISNNCMVTTSTGCIWPLKFGHLAGGVYGLKDGWNKVAAGLALEPDDLLVIRLTCPTTFVILHVFGGKTDVPKPLPIPSQSDELPNPFSPNCDNDAGPSGVKKCRKSNTGKKEKSSKLVIEDVSDDGENQDAVPRKREGVVVSVEKDGSPSWVVKCCPSTIVKAQMRVPRQIRELLPEEDTEVRVQAGKGGPVYLVDYIHSACPMFRSSHFRLVVSEYGLEAGQRVKLVLKRADPKKGILFVITKLKG